MSCDICGRSSCAESFHSLEEQARFEKSTALFEKARELRAKIRAEQNEEEAFQSETDFSKQ